MSKPAISKRTKKFVIERAEKLCEYCKSPADFTTGPFSIEHIIPRSKQGTDNIDNLVYACIGCNVYKLNQLVCFDSLSLENVPIFHPRLMEWNRHFLWDKTFTIILGKTPIG